MASARRSELAELTEVDGLVPADQPKLLVMHGRGGSGKSTLVRVIAAVPPR
jgi:ABC-type sulfate/molybdate transport systems ATPase subunit